MVRSMIRPATTTPAETSRGNPSRRPLAKPRPKRRNRHFPVIRFQTAIISERTARFNRNDLSRGDSCPCGCSTVPFLPPMPPEQRSLPVSAQHQPLPPRIASLCSVAASAMLHQLRRHSEPLDAVKDRCKQLARHRHLGHLKRHVVGVPDSRGPTSTKPPTNSPGIARTPPRIA